MQTLLTGLDHIGFSVSDLHRSIEFYELLLQRPPKMTRVIREKYVADIVGYQDVELNAAFFELPGSSAILELLEYRRPPSARVDMETYNVGSAHLCLIVEDLHQAFERLHAAGVEFRSDKPIEILAGPYKGGKAVYFRDPDGITIELTELPPGGLAFNPLSQ